MAYTMETQQKVMRVQAEETAQPQKHERHQQQDVDERALSAWKS